MLGQMEQLIRDLNSPANQGRPTVIYELQRQIQQLQADFSAWQSALDLLNTDDSLLQFYGALTLNIKVHADWDKDEIGQDRTTVHRLIQQILARYVALSEISRTDAVLSKLAITLAAIFAKPESAWGYPCRHALACAVAGQYVEQSSLPTLQDILATQLTISSRAFRAIMMLGNAMRETGISVSNSTMGHGLHVRLSNNLTDVWMLIQFYLTQYHATQVLQQLPSDQKLDSSSSRSTTLILDLSDESCRQGLFELVFEMIPAWTHFMTQDSSGQDFQAFESIVGSGLDLLDLGHQIAICMSCLSTLVDDHHTLLKAAAPLYGMRVNESAAAMKCMQDCLTGLYTVDALAYVEFLSTQIDKIDTTVPTYLDDQDNISMIQRIQSLLRAPGVATIDDTICTTLLEMTTTIAEGYGSWSEKSNFVKDILAFLTDAFSAVTTKIEIPTIELDRDTQTWDDDEIKVFEDFRFDAIDFFQTIYSIAGEQVVVSIARTLQENAESMTWSLLEAHLFVLYAWADGLAEDEERLDKIFDIIFETPRFVDAIVQESVPDRVRRSTIMLLGIITGYLTRHPRHLVVTLDFLFRSLSTKAQANHASRAILSLCDHQRVFLSSALSQFLETLSKITLDPGASRHRIFQAVATLIQAQPSEEQKLSHLQSLMQISQQVHLESSNADDPHHDFLVEILATLAAIGRGLQSPSEIPIELDTSSHDNDKFWTIGPGSAIQKSVLTLISDNESYFTSPQGGDVVSAICDLLRSGFPEVHPSPFKFTNDIVVHILTALLDLKSPNIDKAVSTATAFVAAAPGHEASSLNILINRAGNIIQEELTVLEQNSQNDRSMISSSILDFLGKVISRRGSQLFLLSNVSEVLNISIEFALKLLQQADILPRKEAASFLSSFIELSAKSQSDVGATPMINPLLEKYFAHIASLPIRCLGGECARSEVETISELLRKVVSHQPGRAKSVLQAAVKEGGVLTTKAMMATKPEQRARFIAQVITLRGARRTNEIAREFWIRCKGSTFGYTA